MSAPLVAIADTDSAAGSLHAHLFHAGRQRVAKLRQFPRVLVRHFVKEHREVPERPQEVRLSVSRGTFATAEGHAGHRTTVSVERRQGRRRFAFAGLDAGKNARDAVVERVAEVDERSRPQRADHILHGFHAVAVVDRVDLLRIRLHASDGRREDLGVIRRRTAQKHFRHFPIGRIETRADEERLIFLPAEVAVGVHYVGGVHQSCYLVLEVSAHVLHRIICVACHDFVLP